MLNFSHVTLRGGLRLRYARQGRPDAPALLLLHGYTDSWFSYSPILPLLPDHIQVIVPDQRGHGDSDRPDNGYELDEFATDAIQLLDALGIRRAAVVGHSMGSFIAQHLAIRVPSRVSHLILEGSAASARNEEVLALMAAVESQSDPMDRGFVRDFQAGTVHRAIPEEFLDAVVSESLKMPARQWKAVLSALLREDWTSQLSLIRCPTLILWGVHDNVFGGADQDVLMRKIPLAAMSVYSGAGHSIHWEFPEEFVRDVVTFCGLERRRRVAS